MATTKEEMKLVEKIVRAKIKLEGFKKEHSMTCNSDQEMPGPCNCGTANHNAVINSILEDLSLE